MNWNAIGAIGQILGSLAVFVTIGFLVVQMHDTEAEMQRAIAQSRADRSIQYLATLATNERLVDIHNKVNGVAKPAPPIATAIERQAAMFINAAMKQAGLTLDQAYSLYVEQFARWNNYAQVILYLDELPPSNRAQFDSTMRQAWADPAFRFWYEFQKSVLTPDAVRYVDSVFAQQPTS